MWQDGDTWPLDHIVVVLDAEHPVSIGWTHNSDNTFTDPNPETVPSTQPQPTLADLQAQLAAIQDQISSIAAKG